MGTVEIVVATCRDRATGVLFSMLGVDRDDLALTGAGKESI